VSDADLGLLRPAPDEIHHLIPHIVVDASSQAGRALPQEESNVKARVNPNGSAPATLENGRMPVQ
jgi:hypothetical protein